MQQWTRTGCNIHITVTHRQQTYLLVRAEKTLAAFFDTELAHKTGCADLWRWQVCVRVCGEEMVEAGGAAGVRVRE